ncbi:MAG: nucleotidyltransferase domain-containing protein [Candidatus Omnitrophica bacterium]|nr:nucleotidyltransferase domain-containing protein [Candidatus Omnitrophota bacterium]MBU1869041.1 nucleotidyltransferase domain-containing protein [Candidatus Omnitrophota bacterium]
MEKKQFELCIEILRRFNKAGILKDFILIGSWCVYFYKDYFSGVAYIDQATIKTRDIDFLINDPSRIRREVDIPALLKDLGFVTIMRGSKGYIKLDHPDLLLEFLVPEKSKGTDKPVALPKLGMNAVALRFLSFLSANTIKARVEDFYIILPHPANFALHKLIISQRRLKQDKAIKDRNAAIVILSALINKGESDAIREVFNSIPKKWQARVIKDLTRREDRELLAILETAE